MPRSSLIYLAAVVLSLLSHGPTSHQAVSASHINCVSPEWGLIYKATGVSKWIYASTIFRDESGEPNWLQQFIYHSESTDDNSSSTDIPREDVPFSLLKRNGRTINSIEIWYSPGSYMSTRDVPEKKKYPKVDQSQSALPRQNTTASESIIQKQQPKTGSRLVVLEDNDGSVGITTRRVSLAKQATKALMSQYHRDSNERLCALGQIACDPSLNREASGVRDNSSSSGNHSQSLTSYVDCEQSNQCIEVIFA